ncbi:hypothetical protein PSENEW3_00003069 [Picochlorum sp. SENEW3]|nr:hypothetical protein PSENEW3_00003069 [Picochlorum sp. SENEW3]
MSIHILIRAVITDTGTGWKEEWKSLVQGFDLEDTLLDVFYRHDAERSDPKHRIMPFWKSRREDSPLNKIVLKTTHGDVELSNTLDTDLDILHDVNGGIRILKLGIRLELGCTTSAVQAPSACDLSISQASSDGVMKNQRRKHQRKRRYESLELSEKGEEQEGKYTVEDMFEYC